jgi:hypothetical protein
MTSKKKHTKKPFYGRAEKDAQLLRDSKSSLRRLPLDHPVPLDAEKIARRFEKLADQEMKDEVDEYFRSEAEITETQMEEVSDEILVETEISPEARATDLSGLGKAREKSWHPAVGMLYIFTRDSLDVSQEVKTELFRPEVVANEMYEAIKLGISESWMKLREENADMLRSGSKES